MYSDRCLFASVIRCGALLAIDSPIPLRGRTERAEEVRAKWVACDLIISYQSSERRESAAASNELGSGDGILRVALLCVLEREHSIGMHPPFGTDHARARDTHDFQLEGAAPAYESTTTRERFQRTLHFFEPRPRTASWLKLKLPFPLLQHEAPAGGSTGPSGL